MTVLRDVQSKYEMSDKLFSSTIENEKVLWKNAWEVGLSTAFMKLRLVEISHNYQLKRKTVVHDYDHRGVAEQTWRYKHVLRHVNYMSHNRASFDEHLDMKRTLNNKDRDILAS